MKTAAKAFFWSGLTVFCLLVGTVILLPFWSGPAASLYWRVLLIGILAVALGAVGLSVSLFRLGPLPPAQRRVPRKYFALPLPLLALLAFGLFLR